jgi:hypothetical protein
LGSTPLEATPGCSLEGAILSSEGTGSKHFGMLFYIEMESIYIKDIRALAGSEEKIRYATVQVNE